MCLFCEEIHNCHHGFFFKYFFMEMEWKEEFFFFRLCLPKLEQMHELGSWEAFDEEKDRRQRNKERKRREF